MLSSPFSTCHLLPLPHQPWLNFMAWYGMLAHAIHYSCWLHEDLLTENILLKYWFSTLVQKVMEEVKSFLSCIDCADWFLTVQMLFRLYSWEWEEMLVRETGSCNIPLVVLETLFSLAFKSNSAVIFALFLAELSSDLADGTFGLICSWNVNSAKLDKQLCQFTID